MARQDLNYQECVMEEDETALRRDTYRVRRAAATRRRTVPSKRAPQPGGIRQRRNKHWNW